MFNMHDVKEGRKWSCCSAEQQSSCVRVPLSLCIYCKACETAPLLIRKGDATDSCFFSSLILPMQTSLKVSFSLMTVSCANWMKMSALLAARLQSVPCSCTNHHPYAIRVPLHARDWVDLLSHHMITDSSSASCGTDIDATSAGPQIGAPIQWTRCPFGFFCEVIWTFKRIIGCFCSYCI